MASYSRRLAFPFVATLARSSEVLSQEVRVKIVARVRMIVSSFFIVLILRNLREYYSAGWGFLLEGKRWEAAFRGGNAALVEAGGGSCGGGLGAVALPSCGVVWVAEGELILPVGNAVDVIVELPVGGIALSERVLLAGIQPHPILMPV